MANEFWVAEGRVYGALGVEVRLRPGERCLELGVGLWVLGGRAADFGGRGCGVRGVARVGPGASCFQPRAASKHLLLPGVSGVRLPYPASCGPHGAWAAGHGRAQRWRWSYGSSGTEGLCGVRLRG